MLKFKDTAIIYSIQKKSVHHKLYLDHGPFQVPNFIYPQTFLSIIIKYIKLAL